MGRWRLTLRFAGRDHIFEDELDADLSRSFAVGVASTDPTEISFDLALPDGSDVGALIEAGHRLDAAEGVVELDDEVVLRGRVVDPTYGHPQRPTNWLAFTLRSSPLEDRALFPPAAAVIDTTSWPTADPSALGRVYPWVFGAPGAGLGPGSPAYLVETPAGATQYLLISDDWVDADSVIIVVPSGGSSSFGAVSFAGDTQLFTVVRSYDGRGRRVSLIDLQEHVGALPVDEGTEFHCQWETAARAGGMGDVLEAVLRASSVRIDYGRLAAVVEPLNAYTLAGCIDEQVRPVEWVTDNLLEIAPFGLAFGPDGLFPLLYSVDRSPSAATLHLVEAPGCEAAGSVAWRGDPLNELLLRYQHRSDSDDYLGIATVDPDSDPYAEASRLRYAGDEQDGVYAEELTTSVIWDAATAEALARSLVRRRALRARVVDYVLDPETWGQALVGQDVTVTSTARHWSRLPGMIENRSDDGGSLIITVALDDDPLRAG